ncbi:MAG: RdgB/HAM1 family non-canonical purine NTP pyrophosphatase [Deltaproteobacteria bacterium]|nr:RdgB/HAM1 family non-canonical purine NTP pyrophosphatase [Deltaproteobacteria bacterium]
MRIVVATSNKGKLREFVELLPPEMRVEGLDAHEGVTLPEETGTTYEQNAVLKAEAAAKATGLPSLGDDSGLEVAPLGNRPGLYSARYADDTRLPGEPQDVANRRKLLVELRRSGAPEQEWHAKFVCALAYAVPGQATRVFRGEAAGIVIAKERGTNGFGYDPLLLLPEYGKTFAELDDRTKNRNSHRGKAVAAWLAALAP